MREAITKFAPRFLGSIRRGEDRIIEIKEDGFGQWLNHLLVRAKVDLLFARFV